jgi:hypothetical protein
MVADGRLHLSGVVLLAAYLTEHTARDLLEAATHQTAKQIERLLAERFPRPDVPETIHPLPPRAPLPGSGSSARRGCRVSSPRTVLKDS